jgi:peptide chain release factor 2
MSIFRFGGMNTDLVSALILRGRGEGKNRRGARGGSLIASADSSTPALIDLTDFKRDLSELTDRLGHAQDCL